MSRRNLPCFIYYTVRDGMSKALNSLLNDVDPEEANRVLEKKITDADGQQLTPLIVAAKYGRVKVIRLLLSKFRPDLEQEGIIKIDGHAIEGASALWCASCAGHLNVVKILIQAGADVNHSTKSKCYNTCLMIAAYKGHAEVVNFLLEKGANPDEKDFCASTALHVAAECGNVDVVKILLKFNAQLLKNDVGMTPIKVAAERTREKVVEYLILNQDIDKEERIEALELLGASYANDKDNYNTVKAYRYLRMSMELRFSNPNNPLKKKLMTPIPAYQNWVECQTMCDLESLEMNNNALHMEALTIRERILGIHNPAVPCPVVYRGAVFANEYQFDRCLDLWMHALQLKQKTYISVVKDLLRFAQVFSQMLHVGVKINYDHVVQVLSAATLELKRNKKKLKQLGSKDLPESPLVNKTTLCLLKILTTLLDQCSDEEKFNVNRMVFTLNELQVAQQYGGTLLHLACLTGAPACDFQNIDTFKFPCADTTRLLIQCGANVNAMDIDGNTPLHVLVIHHKSISDFTTLQSIITDLTEAGAHMDCVNENGETPLECAATEVAEIILRSRRKITLKCIAAKAIKQYKLTYQGQVPQSLESFIELHGTGIAKKA